MVVGGETANVRDFIDPVCKTWKEDLVDRVFYDFKALIIKTFISENPSKKML